MHEFCEGVATRYTVYWCVLVYCRESFKGLYICGWEKITCASSEVVLCRVFDCCFNEPELLGDDL